MQSYQATLAAGLHYAQAGWAVMLLTKDDSTGKIPPRNCPRCDFRSPDVVRHSAADCACLLCHGFYAATTDPERFTLMLNALPAGHLAIRTGRVSDLLVVDAEAHASVKSGGGEGPIGLEVLDTWEEWTGGTTLPETLTARSVSGGLHKFYRLPAALLASRRGTISSGRVLPGVDIKCEGGYVGAVSDGAQRRWLDIHAPVAELPAAVAAWLTDTTRRGSGPGRSGGGLGAAGWGAGGRDGYDFTAFTRDGCPDGQRERFFTDLTFRMRRRGVPWVEAVLVARDAWEKCAQPPEANWFMPWSDIEYKLKRTWHQVEPEVVTATQARWVARVRELQRGRSATV